MNPAFNKSSPKIMHIDINSCFATIEQQANPALRGKPIAVAAYDSPRGVILAPSIEAKLYGVKTGTRVFEGRVLCPNLTILSPDPDKYRYVHIQLSNLLGLYTNNFHPKSIDEFVLNFNGLPILRENSMEKIGKLIKKKIKADIGEWIKVSIGISTNRFLAKTASNYQKPDGLIQITHENYLNIYKTLKLTDLNGINYRNELRLKKAGINSVLDFYNAPLWLLKSAFKSINGYYWHTRLRGYEIDDISSKRKSYGNSYALPKQYKDKKDMAPILAKLVNKASGRVRSAGFMSQGIHLSVSYKDGSHWHKGQKTSKAVFDTRDIYKKAFALLLQSPNKPVRKIAVSCFNLISQQNNLQLELFDNVVKKQSAMNSLDKINHKWGVYTLTTANMLNTNSLVPDRIAFGGIKELEEFTKNFN